MATIPFPFKWQELKPEETEKSKRNYPGFMLNDLIRYDNGVVMPRNYDLISERIYNFTLRDDDIWIVTFPKTGTTWTQELVWMLVNNVDKEKSAVPLDERSPFLEVGAIMGDLVDTMPMPPDMKARMKDPLTFADNMTGRRVLKVHVPLEFLNPEVVKRCKVVYVGRNPKDTCVSFFFHQQMMPGHGYTGDFAEFAELFKAGLQFYGDYWHHLLSGWKIRNEPNVKFLWFEDMKKDQKKIVEELCAFLDHPLSPGQVASLVDHVKFEKMKANPNANPTAGMDLKNDFMRKGEVGLHKYHTH